ncbi:MAG: hypothetical protein AAB432_02730 [Patescibacteria group bacterium]
MRSALSIIIISAIATTAILGIFIMNHVMNNHVRCPIATFAGSDCMNIVNPFEFAATHINATLGFSAGTIVSPVIYSIFAFNMLFALFFLKITDPPKPRYSASYSQLANNNLLNIFKKKWLSWLYTLEKRDPSDPFAVKR